MSQPVETQADRAHLGSLTDRILPGARVIVLAASRDDNPKVTVLLVPPGAPAPTTAVKVATTPAAARSVLREADRLRTLDRSLLGSVPGSAPRLLDLVDHGGLPAMVTEALPGVPLLISYHGWRHTARPSRVQADFQLARNWLASIPLRKHRSSRHAAPWSLRLAARWPADPLLTPACAIVSQAEAQLDPATDLVAVSHGDFWCGNILVSDGAITGVVDWEGAEPAGSPVRDWARFALAYSLYLDRHVRPGARVPGHAGLRADRWGAGLRWALHGNGWYPDLVQHFLREAVVRLGLPASTWRSVAVVGLAEVATVSDHDAFAHQHLRILAELAATARNPQ